MRIRLRGNQWGLPGLGTSKMPVDRLFRFMGHGDRRGITYTILSYYLWTL